MDRASRLDGQVLAELGFRPGGDFWQFTKDERFGIRIDGNCFNICFFGYHSEVEHKPTVGELEKLFFSLTGQLLY